MSPLRFTAFEFVRIDQQASQLYPRTDKEFHMGKKKTTDLAVVCDTRETPMDMAKEPLEEVASGSSCGSPRIDDSGFSTPMSGSPCKLGTQLPGKSPVRSIHDQDGKGDTDRTSPVSASTSSSLNKSQRSMKNLELYEFQLSSEPAPPPMSIRMYLRDQLGIRERLKPDPAQVKQGALGRKRVYNLLLHVPLQLERVLAFGALVCADAFLTFFTTLPLRAAVAIFHLIANLRERDADWRGHVFCGLRPEAVCDLLWVCMIVIGVIVLNLQDVSIIYHFIRGQEIMKLYMVFNLLEIVERLCSSFGADTLDALSHSVGVLNDASSKDTPVLQPTLNLLGDFVVATIIVVVHCLVILLQAITYNVAVNSSSNQIIAILISNNFVEIKGNIFKSLTATKHFELTLQDIVERFHLTICFAFVMLEMYSRGAPLGGINFTTQLLLLVGFEVRQRSRADTLGYAEVHRRLWGVE
ncbi:hypothetical protein CYMTET_36544 [Cymbomonas tetramitiformis]|uniref:Uncharacterized protein n=1 Tax=Cymbomonas tetramitiformis TaxID=36881 RepID=A0AAE0CH98_9CHLO|nr:hypothetical protein CYMTET_36544 [Cymbomonas tetramitiformis]